MSAKHNEGGNVRVAISIGDVNGVGMEIILKTFSEALMNEEVTPVIYGSSKIASYYKKALNMNDLNYQVINRAEEAHDRKLNILNVWQDDVAISMGEAADAGGKYAFLSLEAAVKDLAEGKVDVLVTAPINKKLIQSQGFKFPGHTEYLASIANVSEALMFMVSENLRVGVVTGHVPLADVPKLITKDRILNSLRQMNQSLIRDFGVRKPRIAVLGLNPHAGEGGAIGEEDKNVIVPAVEAAYSEGIMAFGPYPADGLFGSGNFKNFDAVLAMYHDQGLAPFKALSFGAGVNYTAGLPVVRTSPDHGTAYELVGKGEASEDSFRNAVYLAKDVFLNRKFYREITANPLQPQNIKDKGE